MPSWLPFVSWLQQHSSPPGSQQGEAASGRDDSPPAAEPAHPTDRRAQQTRPALQPAIPDCRMEQLMLEGYLHSGSGSARQEMSVVLAVPGLPAHKAPVVTAKQATALLKAISEPLMTLEVGRLTRKLSSPTKLQPSEERGTLTLWLLPNDDLTLIWNATLELQPPAASFGPHPHPHQQQQQGGAGAVAPLQVACSSVAVWEALVHFSEHCFYESEEPVAVIHTLRNDPSGRSFYIRPRPDVAAYNSEQAAKQLEEAGGASASGAPPPGQFTPVPRMYFWLREGDVAEALHKLGRLKGLLRRPPKLANRAGVPPKKLAEIGRWLAATEGLLAQQAQQAQAAAQALDGPSNTQDSYHQQPSAPRSAGAGSSSSREGGASTSASASQPPQLGLTPAGTGATPRAPPTTPSSVLPGMLLGRGSPNPAPASSRMAAALSSVVSSSHAVPTAAFHGIPTRAAGPLNGAPPCANPATAARHTAAARAQRPAAPRMPPTPTSDGSPRSSRGGLAMDGDSPTQLAAVGNADAAVQEPPAAPTASSTVSASASAVYHDRRFNLLAPVAVTVVVTSVVQQSHEVPGVAAAAAQQGAAELQADAVELASGLAQQHAQCALEASGRRMMEEQLAEAVLGTIKASRSSFRQRERRTQQRDQEAQEERRWKTALAMPSIRAAAARAGGTPLPHPASRAAPASPRTPDRAVPATGSDMRLAAAPAAPAVGASWGQQQQVLRSGIAAAPASARAAPIAPAVAAGDGAEGAAPVRAAAAAAAAAPPSRPRRRQPTAAPDCPGEGKVTLSNLQDLLVGSGSACSEGSHAAECSGGEDSACERVSLAQHPASGSDAGDSCKGGGGEKEMEGGDVTPRKVSLGNLFKLLNGCLDV